MTKSAVGMVSDVPGRTRRVFLSRIESVRGLAALAVAVGHTMGYLVVHEGTGRTLLDQPDWENAIEKLASGLIYGETAVIIFFVMSGVVIARSLDSRSGRIHAGRDYVSFLIRRMLRLYPAHIVAMVGILAIAWVFLIDQPPIDFSAFPDSAPEENAEAAGWLNGIVFNPLKWKSIIANFTMASWSMNLVVWSLYVEVLAAPLLPLFHAAARKENRWLDALVLGGLIALSLLNWQHLWSRYLFAFYLGMMVESHGVVLAAHAARWFGGPRRALAMLYLVMMLPNTFAAERTPAIILLESFAAFAIISAIVRSEGTSHFRSLERPLLRWNGRLSYSFYLWHLWLMTIAVRALYASLPAAVMEDWEETLVLAVAALTIVAALAIAQVSYKFIELPGIALGRRLVGLWRGISQRRLAGKTSRAD